MFVPCLSAPLTHQFSSMLPCSSHATSSVHQMGVTPFFAKVTNSLLRGMRVESKKELKQRIEGYVDRPNEDPVVYKWTYKMDEISVA